ncbi:hypothetical protein M3Y99_00168900 [Aphelenchoides fujianensis]|nr:hypothetical protein M3Y99_00168900 [Aphelenchoides fujianensis]
MRRRRRPSTFAFVLLLALPFAVAFDPCDNFDLSACDPAAECWSDQRLVAACRCQAGFADLSPNITHAPGRKCVKVPVATRAGAECSPGDPFSCDQQKAEVCVFERTVQMRFVHTCLLFVHFFQDCPSGYGRLADGRCLAINECTNQPKMHDCAPEAECIDKDVGYECKCPSNLIDVSPDVHRRGRKCAQKVDECKDPERFGVDCHEDARCVDTAGFVDASPDVKRAPGRVCNRPTNSSAPPPSFPLMDHDLCDPNSARACRPNEICTDRDHPGTFTCVCASNAFRFRDGACRLQAACDTQRECDQNAVCTNVFDSFECKCKEGYADVSDDEGALGRRCKKLVNECAEKTHNCDSNAQCVDTEREFTCKCFPGFLDASARYGLPPGRVCSTASNECASPSLNTCDENADCVNRPDGYTCSCIPWFHRRLVFGQPAARALPRTFRPTRRAVQTGQVLNPRTGVCQQAGTCDPNDAEACDSRKREKCLRHPDGRQYTCRCEGNVPRHPVLDICLSNECMNGEHDCDPSATCVDTDESFLCSCPAGFVDQSPNPVEKPGRKCGQVENECTNGQSDCSVNAACIDLFDGFNFNECKSPMLNRCSKHAVCLDEPEGYRCECKDNFVDRSPAGSFGFVCEPPEHPCDNPERNDCSKPDGTCIRLGEDFVLVCQRIDRPQSRSEEAGAGESPCVDPNRNDCHPKAICSAVNGSSSEFACRCRDGYRDDSPSPASTRQDLHRTGERKARRIKEKLGFVQINECLDRSLNDCDPLGVCEDLADGYTCRCPLNSIDQSPDQNRLGRRCLPQIDECANERLNNCSRFADCHDKEIGFELIDECENPALNACHKHAECTDLPGGYSCKCKPPYADAMPEQPGRICLFDECSNSTMNTCSPHATCKDTADGYTCTCREGFYDDAKDAAETGRTR